MDSRTACNISDEEQNRRLRLGVIGFAITLTSVAVLMRLGVAPAYRLVLFVPFLASANAMYMGLFKACGILAAKGMRGTDEGAERIADPSERRATAVLGRKVLLSAFATAGLMTFLLMLLP